MQANLNDKNIIEKSKALLLMKEVPFSLGELKVMDIYLSRINARHETERTVYFTKKEYEKLMGISEVKPDILAKYVESLQKKVIYLPDKDSKKRLEIIYLIWLFSLLSK